MLNVLTELAEQRVNPNQFEYYDREQLPKLILGFQLSNKYDQSRFRFRKLLQPVNIAHKITDDRQTKTVYFHAIELEHNQNLNHLCSTVARAWPVTSQSYQNILKYNRLTCKIGARYLRDGVYPIDVEHVKQLSKNRHRHDYLYLRSLLDIDTTLPWFSSWGNFNIFMLCPSFLSKHTYK